MFERLQRPFLTVETGEAYQPIRLSYQLDKKDELIALLNKLTCCEKNPTGNSWNWFWKAECDDLNFDSIDSYQKNPERPARLGTLTILENTLYLNLPSFKRACLAAPFFHKIISENIAKIHHVDFINKVFGLNERLSHGFTELFKEDELEKIVNQRIHDYEETQASVEDAKTPEEALAILAEYTKKESQKRLPFAERYVFEEINAEQNAEIVFLGFYIYLRGRELVAIRRWLGQPNYSLSNIADETIEKVFGGIDIDIID